MLAGPGAGAGLNPGPGDTEVRAGLTIFFSTEKKRTPREVPQKFENNLSRLPWSERRFFFLTYCVQIL